MVKARNPGKQANGKRKGNTMSKTTDTNPNKNLVVWYDDEGSEHKRKFHTSDEASEFQERLVFVLGFDAEIME